MRKIVKIKPRNFVEKLTGLSLAIYIISSSTFESYSPTSWLATLTLYAFILMSVFYILLKKKITVTYYNIAIWIYGSVLMLSFFHTPNLNNGITTLYWYFTCAVLTFFVVNYLDNEQKIHLVVNAYIVAGVVLAIFIFIIYGIQVFDLVANSTHGMRIGGIIGNENGIGLTLSNSVIFAIYMILFNSKTYIKKFYYLFCILLCFPFALLSGSKKALFLVVIGVVLLILFKSIDKNNLLKRMKYIILGTVLIYLCYWMITNIDVFHYLNVRIQEMLSTLNGERTSNTDLTRLYMINAGFNEFSKKPILGNGVAYSRYIFGTYSHNNYIEVLMNTGLVGLFTYYSFYIISLVRLLKMKFKNKSFKKLALLIIIASIFLELGLVLYYSRYYQILFALISAYICINKSNSKERIDE